MRSGPSYVSLWLVLGLLAIAPAQADVVYLTNGQIFEEVETRLEGSQLRIDLPIGSMSLSLDQVERIDEGESVLGQYQERLAELESDPATGVEAWLELARWATNQGFQRGMRRAALAAATLDPEAEGLAPLMRGLGYIYDTELGVEGWLPYDEAMRRRGLVEDQGEWISSEEMQERARTRAQTAMASQSDDALARRDSQIDKALEIIHDQTKKERPARRARLARYPQTLGSTLGFFPGFVLGDTSGFQPVEISSPVATSLSGAFFSGPGSVNGTTTIDTLVKRQPGSFIPATSRTFR